MFLNKKKLSLLKKGYRENGFVVIKNIFKKDEILKAGLDLENFVSKNLSHFKSRDINKTKNNIINSVHFMNNWSWSKKFINGKKIKLIVKTLLEDEAKNFGSELFAKPAKVGLSSPIHQDNFYWCLDNANGLTVWIALDQSNSKNGGVYYYKKTQRLGLLEHNLSYAPGSSQTLKYPESMNFFKKITPKINIGDCIIHHCLAVHGSYKNTSSKSRRGLTVRYIGKSSKIDKDRKKKYELQLKKNLR
jgi:phytanoyl-CoA hydroxylase